MNYIVYNPLKNNKPVYNFTRSNPESRLKWVWFPVLKVGSTAIRGMINRHLRPEWKENGKDPSYNPVAYKNTPFGDEVIYFNSHSPAHEEMRLDTWTESTPNCATLNAFPGEDTADYFKFAFVRNPWDRVLSCWCDKRYVNKNTQLEEQVPFADFVKSYANEDMYLHTNKHMQMQSAAFLDIEMDFIGRLEDAHHGFSTICENFGIPAPELMLRKNVTEHKHYTEYYDTYTKDIVADIYKDDIERFGYEFIT